MEQLYGAQVFLQLGFVVHIWSYKAYNFFLSCVANFLQMALYESILASPHRTLNGEEADFFFVPALDSCIITRADDAPHLSMEVFLIQI